MTIQASFRAAAGRTSGWIGASSGQKLAPQELAKGKIRYRRPFGRWIEENFKAYVAQSSGRRHG